MNRRHLIGGLCVLAGSAAMGRDGGDAFWDARVVEALPFHDVGSNDWNESLFDYDCPGTVGEYDGKDQWYAIVPAQDVTVKITTCSPITDYDTKLYVFRDSVEWGSVVACDDDTCTGGLGLSYVAEIESVTLEAGYTYFVVVDAYSQSDEGTFALTIESVDVAPPACAGDANSSGMVDIDDLNQVLSAWQLSAPSNTGPEMSGDGVVDIDDLNVVLSNWQAVCG